MTRSRSSRPVNAHRRDPLLSDVDRLVVCALGLGWALGVVSLWTWWLHPDHWVTPSLMLVTSLLLAMGTFQPVLALASILRSSRPAPRQDVSSERIAMVVTKAPGEPWSMVEHTLRCMLQQRTDNAFDVWLADESPGAQAREWCMRHGVHISTRHGVDAYHRPQWPRRTRSKEGNLSYFYDHWGYDNYDIVCQFDADHAPVSGYLAAVMDAFADPGVGYVAAPSICDANAPESWAARGRLYSEAVMHGIYQAGHSDLAPSCIGSHYAVRTAALHEAGGLGPELAEDFSTSFLLNSAGWNGVFAIDAVAHGDGPESFADAMVQEMQWARSLGTVFLEVAPPHWRSLPPVRRVKLAYALTWYPYLVALHLLGWGMVHVPLVTGTPWVDVPIVEMLVRVAVPSIFLIGLIAYVRSCGWLRPSDAPIISWERALFELTRWPWVAVGLVHALVGFLTRRVLSFRLTPKGSPRPRQLDIRVLTPYVVLTAVPIAMVAAFSPMAPGGGYVLLELLAAVTYLIVIMAVVGVHKRENPGLRWRSDLRSHAGLLLVLTLALVAAVGVRAEELVQVASRSALFPGSVRFPDTLQAQAGGLSGIEPGLRALFALPVTQVWLVLLLGLPVWMFWCRRRRSGASDVASTSWVRAQADTLAVSLVAGVTKPAGHTVDLRESDGSAVIDLDHDVAHQGVDVTIVLDEAAHQPSKG